MDNCMNQCINHSRSKRGPPIGGGGKPGGGPTSIGGGAMRPARFQKINMNIPLLKKTETVSKRLSKQRTYIHTYTCSRRYCFDNDNEIYCSQHQFTPI